MQEQDFPRPGWVLQPSFKPKEVTLIEVCGYDKNHIETGSGKWYHKSDVYTTKAEAIQAGWARVRKQQEDLNKKQVSLNKKQEALRKAAV